TNAFSPALFDVSSLPLRLTRISFSAAASAPALHALIDQSLLSQPTTRTPVCSDARTRRLRSPAAGISSSARTAFASSKLTLTWLQSVTTSSSASIERFIPCWWLYPARGSSAGNTHSKSFRIVRPPFQLDG